MEREGMGYMLSQSEVHAVEWIQSLYNVVPSGIEARNRNMVCCTFFFKMQKKSIAVNTK